MEFNHVRQLAAQQRTALLRRFNQVIGRGIFLEGPEVAEFEAAVSKMVGASHLAAVSSGHESLLLVLRALELEKDAEILCPVLAYPSAFPIVQSGYSVRGIDCDENGQVTLENIKKAITPKSRAIIIVHLYGMVGNLSEIISFCKQKKLRVIEDCAQAFGTQYHQKWVGTFGDYGCYSFYPTKNLGALGDGGAIVTAAKQDFELIQKLRKYGEIHRYESQIISGHSRLPELQAAGLNVYLPKFSSQAEKRRKIKEWYIKEFSKSGLKEKIRVLSNVNDAESVPHLVVIEADQRDKLQSYLASQNIPTLIHYPLPIHKVKAFQQFFPQNASFPIAERLAQHILSLPFSSFTTRREVEEVAQKIKEFYET